MFLVHFKSRDLSRIRRQGQFWHIFFTSGSAIIAQDEVDTWTVHTPVPLDFDTSTLDPKEAIYRVLGGSVGPYPIEIDEILVTSTWRPNICIAEKYISSGGRVFLAGDAAHQNIPTGGYGMNTAVGDSTDIGWKLAAVLSGYGGPALLRSYETERRPVAARNIEQSGVHWQVHSVVWDLVKQTGDAVISKTPEGDSLRGKIAQHLTTYDGENKDHGIELGYRYNGSEVVVPDEDGVKEPEWNRSHYTPSTWPGARAPHVILEDGNTSIFDLFGTGREFTIVDFSSNARYVKTFETVALELGIPLKAVHLPDEPHVRKVWERDAVLVRPDDHVAWRLPFGADRLDAQEVERVLSIVLGRREVEQKNGVARGELLKENGFTGTIGNVDQDKVQGFAQFQR